MCMVARGGACVVAPGGHAWLLRGGVVALGGHAWLLWGGRVWLLSGGVVASGGMRGCSQGGHVWLLGGGMCGFFSFFGYNEITVNERAVRILLECILIDYYISEMCLKFPRDGKDEISIKMIMSQPLRKYTPGQNRPFENIYC